MKKIFIRILELSLVVLICEVSMFAFLIGYNIIPLKNENKLVDSISENATQPTQKIIYILPQDTNIVNSLIEDELSTEDILFKSEPNFPTLNLENTASSEEKSDDIVITAPTPKPSEKVSNETLLGSDFKLYHYAPTGNATASGRMPEVDVTVAVDPKYINLGTWLRIEVPDGNGGYKVYKHKVRADDTGRDIKGHTLDIFVSSESEARQCGVIKNARVYIIEE